MCKLKLQAGPWYNLIRLCWYAAQQDSVVFPVSDHPGTCSDVPFLVDRHHENVTHPLMCCSRLISWKSRLERDLRHLRNRKAQCWLPSIVKRLPLFFLHIFCLLSVLALSILFSQKLSPHAPPAVIIDYCPFLIFWRDKCFFRATLHSDTHSFLREPFT